MITQIQIQTEMVDLIKDSYGKCLLEHLISVFIDIESESKIHFHCSEQETLENSEKNEISRLSGVPFTG